MLSVAASILASTFTKLACFFLIPCVRWHGFVSDDTHVQSDGEPPSDESSDDEVRVQEAAPPEQQARDDRHARRAGAMAQRSAAGDMRQQSLVEVLVDREVERPDAAPVRRPRSEVPWSRAAAWEAVAQAQRGQR